MFKCTLLPQFGSLLDLSDFKALEWGGYMANRKHILQLFNIMQCFLLCKCPPSKDQSWREILAKMLAQKSHTQYALRLTLPSIANLSTERNMVDEPHVEHFLGLNLLQ
jgi:hypothetical protein